MTQAGQHGLLAQVPAFRRGVFDMLRHNYTHRPLRPVVGDASVLLGAWPPCGHHVKGLQAQGAHLVARAPHPHNAGVVIVFFQHF